jgi:cyclic pyranopterin phosphate synthase
LRPLLRGGRSDEEISSSIAQLWRARGDRYSELRTAQTDDPGSVQKKIEMSYIGG